MSELFVGLFMTGLILFGAIMFVLFVLFGPTKKGIICFAVMMFSLISFIAFVMFVAKISIIVTLLVNVFLIAIVLIGCYMMSY